MQSGPEDRRTSRMPKWKHHAVGTSLGMWKKSCTELFDCMLQQLVLLGDSTRPHRAVTVDDYLESEVVARMTWPAYSPGLYLIKIFGNFL